MIRFNRHKLFTFNTYTGYKSTSSSVFWICKQCFLSQDLLSICLDVDYGLPGINSGIYLITLVEGRQLREDMMERVLCMKYFILTSILTATSKDQSVHILAKWISIAQELDSYVGNKVKHITVKKNDLSRICIWPVIIVVDIQDHIRILGKGIRSFVGSWNWMYAEKFD